MLSELVTNAVEHGLEGERGTILVRANRDGAKLHVEVINDGKSIPEGATMTGLGTRIVQTLVRGELGGAVEWSNLPHGGT
ncbi:ATP-binding protein, partial [Pauljensenia sp. UMB3104]|uniref:ATP-binding protein n=1 Tax=Pauljensenia sp. UMB3104 TaxID=3046331 RepID=UPI00255046C0|nr:ATP-binding protein [Pauljensenia sp. UMB3104]